MKKIIINFFKKKFKDTQAKNNVYEEKINILKKKLDTKAKKIYDYEQQQNFLRRKLDIKAYDYEQDRNVLRKKLEDTQAKLARSNEYARRLIFYVCLFFFIIGAIISWFILKTYN